jgi:rhodanese-related sulfurtransferase
MIQHLGPQQVAERLGSGTAVVLDIREAWEREIALIPGSAHIPMGELPARVDELPRERDIILYCHHGGRSLQVAHWLERQGYDRLANLDGGIDEWSLTVDPETPRYT